MCLDKILLHYVTSYRHYLGKKLRTKKGTFVIWGKGVELLITNSSQNLKSEEKVGVLNEGSVALHATM